MTAPTGFLWSDWFHLLKEVNYSIQSKYFYSAFQVTVLSRLNSRYARQEEEEYGERINNTEIKSPLFILGHWRNGTTLLHELLAYDDQFAFPNLFEISRPNTFLTREPFIEQQNAELELKKRPMDNMIVTYRSPGEDEAALAVMSLRSPVVSWLFPRYEMKFDRFLTFRGCPQEDLERWKTALVLFMKKLTVRYDRPLVMKSPTHTAKIKILLDLFPDARFVHIHRDPYTVFQSTVKLYNTAAADVRLHDPVEGSINPGIIRRYKDMYDSFFEERVLIPDGQFVEIAFEEFENDKLGVLRRIYADLGLNGFEAALPGFEEYLKKTAGYTKNKFVQIAEPLKSEIAQSWQRSFEEWDYPK